MATRYRQLEAPALLDTSHVNTGGAEAATALANTFKAFEKTAAGLGAGIQQRRGTAEGAAAGATGKPEFQKGWRTLTAYGEAYNNSALRSYAVHAEADAEDTSARLEVEAGTDPTKFRATMEAVANSTIKNAPPEARAVLQDIYGKSLAAGLGRVSQRQAVESNKTARADTAEGIGRSVDRIAQWRASNDPALAVQADEEEVKLQMLVDAAVRDGTISQVEGAAVHKDAYNEIIKQTVTERFKKEIQNPYGDPVKFIRRVQEENKTSEALPPDEEEKLVGSLLTTLREENSLDAAGRAQQNAEADARHQLGDRTATAALLSNQLTQSTLLKMVESDDLEPATARTLLNELTSGDTAKSDPKTLFSTETNLLNMSEEDITTERGLTWADRSRLILKRREWASGWRGTQEGREGSERIDRALGLAPGITNALLSDDQKKQRERALTDWYTSVDALPPAERQAKSIAISEEVIGRTIRNTAQTELQSLQTKRAQLVQRMSTEKLSDMARKDLQSYLEGIDRNIAEAEKKAK